MSNPVGGGGHEPEKPLPPGEYLLALVWFARRESQTGNAYLRCKFVVCAGPYKDRGFFTPWSLDTTKLGCRRRWELWMEQVGREEAVDLDSDQAIASVFKGKCFKAELKVAQRGQYANTDIDRLIYPRLYGKADWANKKAWEEQWGQRGWEQRDPAGDPGPGDADAPATSQAEPAWSEGSSFAGDDDIPF